MCVVPVCSRQEFDIAKSNLDAVEQELDSVAYNDYLQVPARSLSAPPRRARRKTTHPPVIQLKAAHLSANTGAGG